MLVLHLWAALSPSGGLIPGSDSLHSLDLRLLAGPGPQWGGVGVGDEALFAEMRRSSEGVVLEVPVSADPGPAAEVSPDGSAIPAMPTTTHLSFRAPASAHSVQAAFLPWCRGHAPPLPLLLCGDLHLLLTRQLHLARLAAASGLPRPQPLPSPEAPLVFLHVEKTGGSSMRKYLWHAAGRLGLGSVVPCHGGMHCLDSLTGLGALGLRVLANVSVVAGHYSWGVWQDLSSWGGGRGRRSPREGDETAEEGDEGEGEDHPACLMMMRHPVDRAVSYYYQRCYMIADCPGFGRPLASLTSEELWSLVLYDRQGAVREGGGVTVLDEGMSEAYCRALAAEKQTTGVAGQALLDLGSNFSWPLSGEGRRRALRRAGRCLVGSIDRWDDTTRALRLWLPWLAPSLDALGSVTEMRLFAGKETRAFLAAQRPDLLAVLEGANTCDLEAYAVMQGAFERQMRVLDDAAYI